MWPSHDYTKMYLEVVPGNPGPFQPCREEDAKEEREVDQEPAEEKDEKYCSIG